MKKQILIIFFAALLMIMGVSAATFTYPAASGNVAGKYQFNISTTMNNATYCNITAVSASGGESFTLQLTNNTRRQKLVNATYQTKAVIDSNDWVASGTCMNKTGATESVTARTFTIDNTRPTCTFVGFTSHNEYASNSNFVVTGKNATLGYIKFGNNFYLAMDKSITSKVGTFSYNDNELTGIYTVAAYTSDGTNTTACTSLAGLDLTSAGFAKQAGAVAASNAARAGAAALKQAEATTTSNNNKMIMLVAGAVILFLIVRKKK